MERELGRGDGVGRETVISLLCIYSSTAYERLGACFTVKGVNGG